MSMRPRRRAEAFDAVLRQELPPTRNEAPLVVAASALAKVELVTPRPDFTADLRSRLMAEAAVLAASTAPAPAASAPVQPTRRRTAAPTRSRERRLVLATSAAMLLGGGAAMAVTSQSAVPGDHLYPIKRGVERAEAALAPSSRSQGQELMEQATARLGEVTQLLSDGPPADKLVEPTLSNFAVQSAAAGESMIAAFLSEGDQAILTDLRSFTATSLTELQTIATTREPTVVAAAATAARVLTTLDAEALELCGGVEGATTCHELPALILPETLTAASWIEVPVPTERDPYEQLGEGGVVFEALPAPELITPDPTLKPQRQERVRPPALTPPPASAEDEPKPDVEPELSRPGRELRDRLEDLGEVVADLAEAVAPGLSVEVGEGEDGGADDSDDQGESSD